jgi:hypothetical protein
MLLHEGRGAILATANIKVLVKLMSSWPYAFNVVSMRAGIAAREKLPSRRP